LLQACQEIHGCNCGDVVTGGRRGRRDDHSSGEAMHLIANKVVW